MHTTATDPAADARRLKKSFTLAAAFAVILWLIQLIELAAGVDLARYGVYPGTLRGLLGILLAPLIHGSLTHLFSNTLPIIILGTAVLYGYPRSARIVLPVLYLGTGTGVWLFARSAWHIGASGLTFGMMFFIATIGVLRWDTRSIALALIVFFLYGSMIWGIFPGDPAVSFESHLSGAVLGVVLAVLLRKRDAAPPRRRSSWEEEEEITDPEPWRPQDGSTPESEEQPSREGPRPPP